MGNQAQSNRMQMAYGEELRASTNGWNVVPTENKRAIYINSETLKPTKETIKSARLRSDRMGGQYMQVMQGAEGDVATELGYLAMDDWLKAVMMNTWVTCDYTASVTVSTTHTIAVVGATFVTSGVQVGMKIRLKGFTTGLLADNGVHTITAVTNETTVVVSETLTNGTETGDVNVHCIRNGTRETAFTLIKSMTDMTDVNALGARIYHTGCEVDRWRLEAAAKQIIQTSFTWIGANTVLVSDGTIPGGGSILDAIDFTPYVGSLNVCPIKEDGTTMTVVVSGITLEMMNNIRQRTGLGCPDDTPRRDRPISFGQGDVEITGQVQMYFQNLALYTKFLADERTSLEYTMHDGYGVTVGNPARNYFIVTLPQIELMAEDTPASGLNTDIIETINFGVEPYTASDNEKYMIQVDSFA
jgi:hypothetical protein